MRDVSAFDISIVFAFVRLIVSNECTLFVNGRDIQFVFLQAQILRSTFAQFECASHNDDDDDCSFLFCWSSRTKLKYIFKMKDEKKRRISGMYAICCTLLPI